MFCYFTILLFSNVIKNRKEFRKNKKLLKIMKLDIGIVPHACKIEPRYIALSIMDSDARHNTRCDSTSHSEREWR